jgi:hypothetical protein
MDNINIDNASSSDNGGLSVLTNNVFLVIIAAIFLIFLLYKPDFDCRVGTNFSEEQTVEGYRDSRSMLSPTTGPIGYSIPSSNLDKSLQGRFHLTQYDVDDAFGTEYANVKLLAERTADIIADYTLRVVVGPCMNAENLTDIDTRMDCIRGYKYYFSDILKIPIINMFSSMDTFEINPFKKGKLKKKDQQYQAMIGMVQAYAKSLDSVLKVTATKYSELGFMPEEFRRNLSFALQQWFIFRLTQIFRNPDVQWSTLGNSNEEDSQVSSSDFDTGFGGLPKDTVGQTPMTQGKYSVSCGDLNSNKINLNVDGKRLMCTDN